MGEFQSRSFSSTFQSTLAPFQKQVQSKSNLSFSLLCAMLSSQSSQRLQRARSKNKLRRIQVQRPVKKNQFHLQLTLSQEQRRHQLSQLLAFRFNGPRSSTVEATDPSAGLRFGQRYLSDSKLASLALAVRQLPTDEFEDLVQLMRLKLVALPSQSASSPDIACPTSPILPRRIPFPHPQPLFNGLMASFVAPCLHPQQVNPLSTFIQLLASSKSAALASEDLNSASAAPTP